MGSLASRWRLFAFSRLSPPSVWRQSLLQMYVVGDSLTSTCGSSPMTSSSSKHKDETSPSMRTTLDALSVTLRGATVPKSGSRATRWQLERREAADVGGTMLQS